MITQRRFAPIGGQIHRNMHFLLCLKLNFPFSPPFLKLKSKKSIVS